MKRMRPILSAVLAMLLVLPSLTVPAFAGETGYEPTDAYALNYNGVYEGSKWQYFSPYWPAYTYDGKADYTQSISFTLHHTVSEESFPAYCTDLVVGLDNNSDFRRLNLEDSTYAAGAAGLLRSVMLQGFPSVTAEELGRAAGVEGLTVGEAVAATQAAVWKAAHGERLTFTDFCDTIDVEWNRDATAYFDECYAEIESGYASAANEAQIEAHIEKVYNYLISLAPTAPAAAAVSAASFRSWSSPVLSRNADGTYNVTVEAAVDLERGAGDSMTITAVMENDSAAELVKTMGKIDSKTPYILAGNVLEDPESVKKLGDSNEVILLGKRYYTKIDEIQRIKILLSALGKSIIGAVVLEEVE